MIGLPRSEVLHWKPATVERGLACAKRYGTVPTYLHERADIVTIAGKNIVTRSETLTRHVNVRARPRRARFPCSTRIHDGVTRAENSKSKGKTPGVTTEKYGISKL